MIKRLFGVLAALGILTGATAGAAVETGMMVPPLKPKVTAFYMCNGLHLKAIYDNRQDMKHTSHVSFVWGAKDYHLPQVQSADGSRYAGHGLEWWSKGQNATLSTLPEHNVLTTCVPGKRF